MQGYKSCLQLMTDELMSDELRTATLMTAKVSSDCLMLQVWSSLMKSCSSHRLCSSSVCEQAPQDVAHRAIV